MKVAIVCDWLTNVGGAERVLKSIHDIFPKAPIYTSQYDEKGIDWFKDADVRTGWLQKFSPKLRRFLAPLRQIYFNHLDLSSYDLIISVTGAEAKSIKKGNALHICYCHVPTQYYWQLYDDYLADPGFGALNPAVRFFFKILVKPLRRADFNAAQRPDYFITISTYAAEQIRKYYKRESTIIAPPVAVEKFSTGKFSTEDREINRTKSQVHEQNNQKTKMQKRQGYISTSRQVVWKRLDLAVKACKKLNEPLTLIGDGPEHKRLQKFVGNDPIVTFLPTMNQASLKKYLSEAKGYIFPSLEPFGIAPVEALAAGCPVIAYGKGGAVDYVIDGENGVLFNSQSVNSLVAALKKFKAKKFDPNKVAKTALPFSEDIFKTKIKNFIHEKLN